MTMTTKQEGAGIIGFSLILSSSDHRILFTMIKKRNCIHRQVKLYSILAVSSVLIFNFLYSVVFYVFSFSVIHSCSHVSDNYTIVPLRTVSVGDAFVSL